MKLFKKPGSQNWYYRFTLRGREYKGSTCTADKHEAEKEMRRQWTRVDAEVSSKSPLHPSITVLRDADLERAEKAQVTRAQIDGALVAHWRALARHWGDNTSYTLKTLENYVAARQREGVRNQTIRRELTTLKRGLLLVEEQYELDAPRRWPSLRSSPEKEAQKGHFIEQPELVRWLSKLKPTAFNAALVMILTGVRRTELARITPAMVGQDILMLTRESTKGRKKREIGLVPRAREALLSGIPFGADHKKAFQRAARDAGTARGVIHSRDLRATCATVAEEAGDSRGVDLMMGHSAEVALRYQKAHRERMLKLARYVDSWLGPVAPAAPLTRKISAQLSATPESCINMQNAKSAKSKDKSRTRP